MNKNDERIEPETTEAYLFYAISAMEKLMEQHVQNSLFPVASGMGDLSDPWMDLCDSMQIPRERRELTKRLKLVVSV